MNENRPIAAILKKWNGQDEAEISNKNDKIGRKWNFEQYYVKA